MTEQINYSQIGQEDLKVGTGTFQTKLADGRIVTLSEVNVVDLMNQVMAESNPLNDIITKGPWVDVRAFITGGTGTSADPWTGWDTAISWSANKTYYFPVGHYSYSSAPNWGLTGIRIVGEPGTTLNFTGTGNAVVFDTGASGNTYDMLFENFKINGNASATNGVYLRSIHHSIFRNINVTNVSASGLLTNFAVANTYDNFTCSSNEGAFTTQPVNGMIFSRRDSLENSTASAVINPIIEGVSGTGIILEYGDNMEFHAGTSESNNRGVEISNASVNNTFINTDLESNTQEDVLINNGSNNVFLNLTSTNEFKITTGFHNVLIAGRYNTITLSSGASITSCRDFSFSNNGGSFSDSGTDTTKINVRNGTSGALDPTIIPNTIYGGSGTPEGSVTADVGSIYNRTDGGASTSLYVKESGTGNTGWVAK